METAVTRVMRAVPLPRAGQKSKPRQFCTRKTILTRRDIKERLFGFLRLLGGTVDPHIKRPWQYVHGMPGIYFEENATHGCSIAASVLIR